MIKKHSMILLVFHFKPTNHPLPWLRPHPPHELRARERATTKKALARGRDESTSASPETQGAGGNPPGPAVCSSVRPRRDGGGGFEGVAAAKGTRRNLRSVHTTPTRGGRRFFFSSDDVFRTAYYCFQQTSGLEAQRFYFKALI